MDVYICIKIRDKDYDDYNDIDMIDYDDEIEKEWLRKARRESRISNNSEIAQIMIVLNS